MGIAEQLIKKMICYSIVNQIIKILKFSESIETLLVISAMQYFQLYALKHSVIVDDVCYKWSLLILAMRPDF